MSERNTIALGEPPDEPVPVPTVPAPPLGWRAHADQPGRSHRGAWWYASGPDGRFNLDAPRGNAAGRSRRQNGHSVPRRYVSTTM